MDIYFVAIASLAVGALLGIGWDLRNIKDHLKVIADQLTIANKKK
jgi:hypothetical protein